MARSVCPAPGWLGVTTIDQLCDLFAAVFAAAQAGDMQAFGVASDHFNALYRRASVAEQGEYHRRVAIFMQEAQ